MAAKRRSARKVAKKARKKAAKSPAARGSRKTAAKPAKRASKRPAKSGSVGKATDALVGQIQQVIDVMVAAGAVEVEMEEAGHKLRIRLKEDQPQVSYAAAPAPREAAHVAAPKVAAPASDAAAEVSDQPGEVFRSPMVGTFYRAPSPDADMFVKVGDQIGEDSVICIIEAMKVMNEIKAEMEGEIVEVLAQNGEPVEFGQPLFRVKV